MKRANIIKELVEAGCYLKRHGKKHDIYANSINGKLAPITRHSDIKESLCNLISVCPKMQLIRNASILLATHLLKLARILLTNWKFVLRSRTNTN